MQAREAVAAHLEALCHFVATLVVGEEARQPVLRQLQATASIWGASAPEGEVVAAALAVESCGAVVSVLRLLHSGSGAQVGLDPGRCASYAGAFLALACTVRAFEEARGLPISGQAVTISGLQSEVGQRLNGVRGVVDRFHPGSGRFIVRLNPEDPPCDWKKVRAQNLEPDGGPDAASTQAADGARECGCACLEAVAGVFDDLLREMQGDADAAEEEENFGFAMACGRFLHPTLALAMWEALICCVGDGGLQLRGAGLLELCSGDAALCALLARHVLSAHLGACAGMLGRGLSAEQEFQTLEKVRGLQESFVRAYCGLYQPAALWGTQDGLAAGDTSMADLQTDLDAHIQSMACSAVHLGVLPAMADAADFHLSWACNNPGPSAAAPLALPVMLCRLVCTVLASATSAQAGTLRRHVCLLTPALVEVIYMVAELLTTRGALEGASPVGLGALRAVLDGVVALVGNGLWDMGEDIRALVWSTAAMLLKAGSPSACDPAVLARLVLVLLRQPQEPLLLAAYSALDGEAPKAAFWQQLRVKSRLCQVDAEEAQLLAQQWLGEAELPTAMPCNGAASTLMQEINDVDKLIDKCLTELPMSLKQPLPPPPPLEVGANGLPQVPAAAATAAGLGALDLPSLPGQQPRDGAARTGAGLEARPRRRIQRLARADLAKIRGVDAAAVPEELRCAIDGKLLGAPLRSPYGHLFERETLEEWLSRCGSVCPITGQPLRLEECQEDRAIEHQVVEWAKAAKAEHKRRNQERRQGRGSNGLGGAGPDLSMVL